METFTPIPRVNICKDTLWEDYAAIVKKYDLVNLGTYQPDSLPLNSITQALNDVLSSDNPSLHQYTKSSGHPRLVNVLSKVYSKFLNRNVDPTTEVMTTLGASEALTCSILGLIDVGDEVIIIEPCFNPYISLIKTAGGIPKFISLKQKIGSSENPTSADWVLDPTELENLFSNKTKAIIVNNPNNPLGKVFSLEELNFIADLCKKWNSICISDEVYEWMVYQPKEHIRIASLPGMWERTVAIGSAGKSFSITGWKVGWIYGSSQLISSLMTIHQAFVYTGSTPLEETIARVFEQELPNLGKENTYFSNIPKELKLKRDCIVEILRKANFIPVIPEAGAFLIADWSALEPFADLSTEIDEYKDFRFTKWLAKNVGLLGIPVTPYYTDINKKGVEKWVRICFIKKTEYLEKAAGVLSKIAK